MRKAYESIVEHLKNFLTGFALFTIVGPFIVAVFAVVVAIWWIITKFFGIPMEYVVAVALVLGICWHIGRGIRRDPDFKW